MFNMSYELGMLNEKLCTDFLLKGRGRAAYRGFFEALLDLQEGRAILWHCTDGKDRTGCAVMLVLFALGADCETAILVCYPGDNRDNRDDLYDTWIGCHGCLYHGRSSAML